MRWIRWLKRAARRTLNFLGGKGYARFSSGVYFSADDIGWICETYFRDGPGPGTRWDGLRDAHMRLPEWFRLDLDPLSAPYAEQQHRLWQLVSGVERPYEPDIDEKEHSWGDIDPVRSPGYFVRRDPNAMTSAADHVLATGMFLKHSGLKAGDWALEYGAGFGQTALAFARLGVNVDTVDISTTFCDFVTRQAEFFKVPLNAFHGHFGDNPRIGQKYQVIWFYESFHHCLDFLQVVHKLRDHLADGGRVILGGEPIFEREYAAVPYPWGVRLHSEVVAVVRKQHWFELGFSERFLFELFAAAGFVGRRVDCEPSLFGRLYIFERRPDAIDLSTHWLPAILAEQWHKPRGDGRSVKGQARLPIDAGDSFSAIEIDVVNLQPLRRRLEIGYGNASREVKLLPRQRATIRFEAINGVRELIFRPEPRRPSSTRRLGFGCKSLGGLLVRRVRYVVERPRPHGST